MFVHGPASGSGDETVSLSKQKATVCSKPVSKLQGCSWEVHRSLLICCRLDWDAELPCQRFHQCAACSSSKDSSPCAQSSLNWPAALRQARSLRRDCRPHEPEKGRPSSQNKAMLCLIVPGQKSLRCWAEAPPPRTMSRVASRMATAPVGNRRRVSRTTASA